MPPAVDVEHRHHRQHHVGRAGAQAVGQRRSHRVQHGRAVAVEHALRVAGGAAGVAQGTGGVLVEAGPVVLVAVRRQQVLVAQQVGDLGGNIGGRHVGTVGQRDPVLDGFGAPGHGLDQRQESHVEEQHLVFGVVGDVDDLVRVQPRVQSVQHDARAADAEVQLHVAVAVPGQCGHAFTLLNTQRGQRVGHAARAPGDFLVGGAVDVAFHAPRDHFLLGVVALGVGDE